jgi:hydrogenase maturation protease
MRIVILGIGNIILTDEGLGVRTVERIQDDYVLPEGVVCIDGGTSGMELIEDLSDLDLLVILDVIKAGALERQLIRIAGSDIPVFFRKKLSPHQIALPDVLASLELLGTAPKDIVVLGVEPTSLELGTELTPSVAACIPMLVDAVVDELHEHGVELVARERA